MSTIRGWVIDRRNGLVVEEAEAHFKRALEAGLAQFGPRDNFTFWTAVNYAVYLRGRGRIEELRAQFVEDAKQRADGGAWDGEVTELVPFGAEWQFAIGEDDWALLPGIAPLGSGNDDINSVVIADQKVVGATMRLRKTFEVESPQDFDECRLVVFYAGRCKVSVNGNPIEFQRPAPATSSISTTQR